MSRRKRDVHSQSRDSNIRREKARRRQEKRDLFTDEGQLLRLDLLFGKDQGAKKERARLKKRMGCPS